MNISRKQPAKGIDEDEELLRWRQQSAGEQLCARYIDRYEVGAQRSLSCMAEHAALLEHGVFGRSMSIRGRCQTAKTDMGASILDQARPG